MNTEKVSIKHTFTDEERLALGEEQSQLLGKQDELEAQLKSAKTQIQAQIDAGEANIRNVSSKLRTRYEMRQTECILMDHRIPGMRYTVRTDNGHVATGRKLRSDEMQVKITDEPPEKYVAIGTFPVDAEEVDAEELELKVFADELELLQKIEELKFKRIPREPKK